VESIKKILYGCTQYDALIFKGQGLSKI